MALQYYCQSCEKWSDASQWKDDSIGCDICGFPHEAKACPLCGELTDLDLFPGLIDREEPAWQLHEIT